MSLLFPRSGKFTHRSRPATRFESALLRVANICVPQPVPQKSGSDRREFPRRESVCTVAVFRIDSEPISNTEHDWKLHSTTLRGPLTDVSMNGIALKLACELTEMESVLLRIHLPQSGRHIDRKAKVLRSVRHPDGHWRIVCRFDDKLTYEEVSAAGRPILESQWV